MTGFKSEFFGFPKIPRWSRECMVTEKLDGTNAQITIVDGSEGEPSPHTVFSHGEGGVRLDIYAGSRKRWLMPEGDNHGFAKWVRENGEELLKLGVGTHFGEWWGQGIQRNYGLRVKKFSLFNWTKWSGKEHWPCDLVPLMYAGPFPPPVDELMERLRRDGSCAVPGYMNPEGIVIFHCAGNLLFKKTLDKDQGKESVDV